jgi:hypothetical protein
MVLRPAVPWTLRVHPPLNEQDVTEEEVRENG